MMSLDTDILTDTFQIMAGEYQAQKQKNAKKRQRKQNQATTDKIHKIKQKNRKVRQYINDDGNMLDLKRIKTFDDLQ